ncbi:MAG: helix-turn-helix transcriptional regulator [Firmicutes bacterium]|nr:helix-turn-helix transcriptional regulator [Bacillota bacterium]
MQGLGQRIRAARKAAGLTQQALAGSDFTVGFISQLENGLVRPSLRSLEVLARRLGLPLSYFLDEPAPGPDDADLDRAERLLEAGRVEEAARVLAPLAAGAAGALPPRARRLLGMWRLRTGSPAAALEHLEAALAATGEGDPAEKARIHHAIASALVRLRRWEEAADHLAQALALLPAGADPDPVLRMKVGTNLALLYGRLGRDEECLELGERVLQWARETGLTFRLADLLQVLAAARHRRGDPEGAVQYYRMARLLYDLLGEDRPRARARQGPARRDPGGPPQVRAGLKVARQPRGGGG